MTEPSTPLMRQYAAIKKQHPNALLFFRLGDFYELFFEDAVVAARELQITLTSRNKEKDHAIPMCGVPYHAAENYLSKLLRKGFKVAICEQMEVPSAATKLVRRELPAQWGLPRLIFPLANFAPPNSRGLTLSAALWKSFSSCVRGKFSTLPVCLCSTNHLLTALKPNVKIKQPRRRQISPVPEQLCNRPAALCALLKLRWKTGSSVRTMPYLCWKTSWACCRWKASACRDGLRRPLLRGQFCIMSAPPSAALWSMWTALAFMIARNIWCLTRLP